MQSSLNLKITFGKQMNAKYAEKLKRFRKDILGGGDDKQLDSVSKSLLALPVDFTILGDTHADYSKLANIAAAIPPPISLPSTYHFVQRAIGLLGVVSIVTEKIVTLALPKWRIYKDAQQEIFDIERRGLTVLTSLKPDMVRIWTEFFARWSDITDTVLADIPEYIKKHCLVVDIQILKKVNLLEILSYVAEIPQNTVMSREDLVDIGSQLETLPVNQLLDIAGFEGVVDDFDMSLQFDSSFVAKSPEILMRRYALHALSRKIEYIEEGSDIPVSWDTYIRGAFALYGLVVSLNNGFSIAFVVDTDNDLESKSRERLREAMNQQNGKAILEQYKGSWKNLTDENFDKDFWNIEEPIRKLHATKGLRAEYLNFHKIDKKSVIFENTIFNLFIKDQVGTSTTEIPKTVSEPQMSLKVKTEPTNKPDAVPIYNSSHPQSSSVASSSSQYNSQFKTVYVVPIASPDVPMTFKKALSSGQLDKYAKMPQPVTSVDKAGLLTSKLPCYILGNCSAQDDVVKKYPDGIKGMYTKPSGSKSDSQTSLEGFKCDPGMYTNEELKGFMKMLSLEYQNDAPSVACLRIQKALEQRARMPTKLQ